MISSVDIRMTLIHSNLSWKKSATISEFYYIPFFEHPPQNFPAKNTESFHRVLFYCAQFTSQYFRTVQCSSTPYTSFTPPICSTQVFLFITITEKQSIIYRQCDCCWSKTACVEVIIRQSCKKVKRIMLIRMHEDLSDKPLRMRNLNQLLIIKQKKKRNFIKGSKEKWNSMDSLVLKIT